MKVENARPRVGVGFVRVRFFGVFFQTNIFVILEPHADHLIFGVFYPSCILMFSYMPGEEGGYVCSRGKREAEKRTRYSLIKYIVFLNVSAPGEGGVLTSSWP